MNKDNYHSHKREHWNSYLFVKKAVKYQQRKKKWKKPKRFVWRLKKEKNAQTHVMHKNKKYEKRYSNCKFFEQRIFMKLLKYIRKSLYILQLRFLFFWSQRLVPIFTNPLTDFHSNARKGRFLPTNHTALSSTTIDFLIETKGKMKIIVAWKSNEFLSLVFRIPLCYWNIVIDVTIAGSRFAGSIIDLTVFLMNAVLSSCSVSRSGDKCVITKNKWFSTKRCSFETN